MPAFALLLPPAEGKQPGGNPFAPDFFDLRARGTFNFFHELNPERKRLLDALQAALDAPESALETLFGVKGDTLTAAVEVNRDVRASPRMAALERYGPGVLYRAMEFASLPTGAQRRLLENTVLFSGLFGPLRADDLIPNYRLRMDASLPGVGRVSRYWRPLLSPVVDRFVEDRVVWNLLPAAHRDAWEPGGTYRELIDVVFAREQGGERRVLSHGVKPLRGRLARFVAETEADSVEALRAWRAPEGFRLDESAFERDEATRTTTVLFVQR